VLRGWWRQLAQRRRPPPIDDLAWRIALERAPLARRLAAPDIAALRDLVARFLDRKRFHAIADAPLDDQWRLLIAIQACLPVLRQGAGALRGWSDIVVYPGEFRVRRNHRDERTGVVSESNDVLIGEAWERGPLVLSLANVALDLEEPWEGYNVIVHEMAHKLDMLDGPANGVPPLPASIVRREWIAHFQAAFDRLVRDVRRGHRTMIDPYAAEDPQEYFAVTSELHFSQPSRLAEVEPDIAKLLTAFYGPSPAPALSFHPGAA
jgi:Mlc titration factor MtfA (ptsG expression regulator)